MRLYTFISSDVKNAIQVSDKQKNDVVVFCSQSIDDKRQWLKDLKAILKEFQKKEYYEMLAEKGNEFWCDSDHWCEVMVTLVMVKATVNEEDLAIDEEEFEVTAIITITITIM